MSLKKVHIIGPFRSQFQFAVNKPGIPPGYEFIWHDKEKMPKIQGRTGQILVVVTAWIHHKNMEAIIHGTAGEFERVIYVHKRGNSSLTETLRQLPPISPVR